MKYLSNCRTLDELQQLYRKLLAQMHPDKHPGESPEQIKAWTVKTQELNAEYSFMAAILRNAEQREKARAAGKPEPTKFDEENWARVDEEIRKVIEQIVFLPDIEIEICGFWVWVGGDTKPVKDQLKAAGLHWAGQKSKWYYAGVPSSGRGSKTMEQIRNAYGSTRVQSKSRTRLEDDK